MSCSHRPRISRDEIYGEPKISKYNWDSEPKISKNIIEIENDDDDIIEVKEDKKNFQVYRDYSIEYQNKQTKKCILKKKSCQQVDFSCLIGPRGPQGLRGKAGPIGPTGPPGGGGGGGSNEFFYATGTVIASTTSSTFFSITNMTITVTVAGFYNITFNAYAEITVPQGLGEYGIFINNVLISESLRKFGGIYFDVNNFNTLNSVACANLNVGDIITIQYNYTPPAIIVSTSGSFVVLERTLTANKGTT